MKKRRSFFRKKLLFGVLLIAIGILGAFIVFHGGFEGGIISGHFLKSSDSLSGQSFVGNSGSGLNSVTGFLVLDNPANKLVAYGIFLAIITIGVILIVWSNWHDRKKEEQFGKKRKR